MEAGRSLFEVRNHTRNRVFTVRLELGDRDRRVLLAGGLLNYAREEALATAS